MTLIWLCTAFLCGVVAANHLDIDQPWSCASIGIGALLLAWLWRHSHARLPLLLVAALMFGVARTSSAMPNIHASAVGSYVNTNVSLVGVIDRAPDRRDDRQTVVVEVEGMVGPEGSRPTTGLVQLQLGSTPELNYGDRIEVMGRLLQPRQSQTFDAHAYLARQGIYTTMEHPTVRVLEAGRGPRASLTQLNERLHMVILRSLPEPHAGLLVGMILGKQGAIPRSVLDDFRATGASHVIVISGWNISILVGAISGLLMAIGLIRRYAMLMSLPILVAYVVFVGASPAVLRAGIMGALVVWAEVAERESDGWTGLLLACALLAGFDPNIVWDIGFQLSALATAGIFAWSTRFRRRLAALPLLRAAWLSGVVETLAMTFAALLPTLPILMYSFGMLSLVAPLANVVIVPAVPLAMLFGGLGAVAGLIAEPLGQLVSLLAWPFTTWMLTAVHVLARFPAATMHVSSFSIWWLWLWYAGLAALLAWQARRPSRPIAALPEAVHT